MLKLVTLAALLAVVVAKPQYPLPIPVFAPYATPYYNPYVPNMKSTGAAIHYPAIPTPYFYPYPIHGAFPYHPAMKASFQDSIPESAPSPVAPAPVETPLEAPKEPTASFRVPSFEESPLKDNPSLQLADLILNAEQKRQLEEAVVAMNPLEYAARLQVLKDPKAAMKLFDRY